MLDLVRKHSKSWVTAVIIGCIAMVFIFWGLNSSWEQPAGKSLEVNGETITQNDIDLIAKTMAIRLQMRFGASLDKAALEQMINDQTVVRIAVNDRLMQQTANRWGLSSSDDALKRIISRDPLFQRDGRFDFDLYQNLLANLKITASGFEEHTRRQVTAGLVNNVLSSLAGIVPQQSRERYHLLNDQIKAEYLFFDRSGFQAGLTASEKELSEFFQQHGPQWRLPARIKVNLTLLNTADLLDRQEVQVEEEELKNFYDEHPERFHNPPRAEISHLLLLLPSVKPTEEQLAELERKAQDLLERSRSEDFTDLIREYSQDPETASSGGSLGWHEPGELAPAIDELVFSSLAQNRGSAGESPVLGPVRSPLGYHLVKITADEPEKITGFAEAKEDLAELIKLTKARTLAWDTMQTLQDNARVSRDLKLSAETQGLTVTSTGWFTQENPDPALKGLDALLVSAFEGAPGDILDLVENERADAFYLVEVVAREEAFTPPLEQIKDAVTQAWVESRANEMALAAARDFLAQARVSGWDAAKEQLSNAASQGQAPTPGLTAAFGRLDETAEGIDLGMAVFQLGQVGQWADQPVPSAAADQAGWYVLRLDQIQPADEQAFEDQQALWTNQLHQEKAREFIEAWLKETWEGPGNKISSSGS